MLFRSKSNKRVVDAGSAHPAIPPTSSIASDAIRHAEKLIQRRNYGEALEELAAAQKIDPKNQYIMAIIDRIYVLQTNPDAFAPQAEIITDEMKSQIRSLTESAKKSMRKGKVLDAFDSLMDAYLIDPVSPLVMECEKVVLPAWELGRQETPGKGGMTSEELMESLSKLSDIDPGNKLPDAKIFPLREKLSSVPEDTEEHFAAMGKKQEEAERLRRSYSLWRGANHSGL